MRRWQFRAIPRKIGPQGQYDMMDNGVHVWRAVCVCLAGILLLALAACDVQAPLLVAPVLPVPTEALEAAPSLTPTPTDTPQPTPTATRVVIPSPALSPTPYLPLPKQVVNLANAAALTDRARELFFAARPVIDPDRATLDKHCRLPSSVATVELGCFTGDGRIYILNIKHQDLQKAMIVIAAHEMLHAAYTTISASEAATLTVQLDRAAAQIHDAQLHSALDSYNQFEPGQRSSELHSLLGTEDAPLPPDLERYYAQYFKDRSVVAAAAKDFRTRFGDAPARIKAMQDDLNSMKTRLEALKRANDRNEYNKLVATYNARIKEYEAAIKQYYDYTQVIFGK